MSTRISAVIFGRPPRGAGTPAPVETKTGAVPADNGVGRDDDEHFGPAGPELSQRDPEEPVQPAQAGARPLPLEDCHLLTQSEDFEGRVAATADEDADCGKEREDE